MNPNTGAIQSLSEVQQIEVEKAYRESAVDDLSARLSAATGGLVPLTKEQQEALEPLGGKQRKGYMRNKPCVCGSGIKFKRCCWDKFANGKLT